MFDNIVISGYSNAPTECIDGLSSVPSPTQTIYGGDAWVIPAPHLPRRNQLENFSLRELDVGYVQTRKFPDVRAPDIQLLKYPVILVATNLELQGAQRVIDVLYGVNDGVRVVVGGVYTPGVSRMGAGGGRKGLETMVGRGVRECV